MSRAFGVPCSELMLVAVGWSGDDDAAETTSSISVPIGADGLDASEAVPAGQSR